MRYQITENSFILFGWTCAWKRDLTSRASVKQLKKSSLVQTTALGDCEGSLDLILVVLPPLMRYGPPARAMKGVAHSRPGLQMT